ncbi:UDP-N-acetylglucosamine transporter-like [Pollicipes pollicipes]|uniref:UDP-N-acetylglucosamine transporter-like n=1 Tax=Pollicipes pollicipes TaxID=41117 RepID=UPI0018856312|nr:UDP-N-acetylglucosamine transporter-like [Pollicipes pollicipes]
MRMCQELSCRCASSRAGSSTSQTAAVLRREVLGQPWHTLPLAVPSFLYTIQNNLVFVALTYLDAPTFQVSYQLKILVTALMSSVMLKRRVRPLQWLALLTLVVGVCLVQLDRADGAAASPRGPNNYPLGLLAVLTLCLSSGYAGVYFERLLKQGGQQPLSVRNVQLAVFSVPFSAAAVVLNDGAAIARLGFFCGYTRYTWTVVVLQALGGLAVSATVKYADNILKGFATSISIVLSALFSWAYLGDVRLSALFGVGALLVVAATFLYGYSPPPPRSKVE